MGFPVFLTKQLGLERYGNSIKFEDKYGICNSEVNNKLMTTLLKEIDERCRIFFRGIIYLHVVMLFYDGGWYFYIIFFADFAGF